MSRNRGVYFLANDRFLDYATAFLNSFRRFNPTIALCLIPYADDLAGLRKLQSRYRFTILDDPELLDACDDIGTAFRGSPYGHFRKLAMWEGEFDEFVYIDCDTVVLHDVEFAFDLLTDYGFLTAHGNDPATRRYVWNDSISDTRALTDEQISFAGATGFIASRKQCLRLDDVRARMPEAIEFAPHMFPDLKDQPLLNFLMVTSTHRYTSLFGLTRAGADLPLEWWGGHTIAPVQDGRIIWPHRHPPLLMHWSGQARQDGYPAVNQELWDFYRHTDGPPASIRATVPTIPANDSVACSFEDGTTQGWYSRSSGTQVAATTVDAHHGMYSLLTSGRTEPWEGPHLELPVPMTEGSAYTFSLWARLIDGDAPSPLKLSVDYTVAGRRGFDSVTADILVTADTWTALEGGYTLAGPADRLGIYVESSTGTASFYIDDFSMTIATSASAKA